MNVKRFIIAGLILFVFFFFYDWLVNGYLLMGIYEQTPRLWRESSQMAALFPFAVLIKLILAGWLSFVFTRFCDEGGVYEGFLFGIYFGVFWGILSGSAFLWMPISAKLGWSWFVSGIIEGVLGGLILGSIYQNYQEKSTRRKRR